MTSSFTPGRSCVDDTVEMYNLDVVDEVMLVVFIVVLDVVVVVEVVKSVVVAVVVVAVVVAEGVVIDSIEYENEKPGL